MKKVFKCGTILLAASIFASAYKDEIKQCVGNAKQMMSKAQKTVCKKPTIVLMYDSTPCTCEDVACDGQPSHENDEAAKQAAQNKEVPCCCGCDLDAYKNLFKKFADVADSSFIDTRVVCPVDDAKCNSYIDRFELEYVPAVLVITPNENLIAKIEAPEKIEDVEIMLSCYLR